MVDCKTCRNRDHDCLTDIDGTCDNYATDCKICEHIGKRCMCLPGEQCGSFRLKGE